MGHNVLCHISKETNVIPLWSKLKSLFEKETESKKAFLIKEVVNMKYKEGLSVAIHWNNSQRIINQLSIMCMNIDNELQTLLLLGSLSDSLETFIVIISNSAPNGILSINNIKDNMFN